MCRGSKLRDWRRCRSLNLIAGRGVPDEPDVARLREGRAYQFDAFRRQFERVDEDSSNVAARSGQASHTTSFDRIKIYGEKNDR
jgi:hypothetical protein